jgi:hypothetical protein
MHKKLRVIFIGIALCYNSCGNRIKEPQNDTERIFNLQIDIDNYKNNLLRNKISNLAHLTMPKFIELKGGYSKFSLNLEKNLKCKARSGRKTITIKIKDIGIIIRGETCLYSILDQEMVLSDKQNPVIKLNTKLIAQSLDNGATWKFLNVDYMRRYEIIKLFPAADILKLKKYINYNPQAKVCCRESL